MELEGIESTGVFYDDKNFPRGFGKSGEFTIAEADVLHKYGKTLKALEQGVRNPSTEQEKSFVAFCKKGGDASSLVEKAWQKYQNLVNRRVAVSVFGAAPIVEKPNVKEADTDIDEVDNLDDGA